jgi:DNA modification methylase
LPLTDASVDLIVTSPPYYALRSYTDGGEHYDGQIGSETTPAEYIAALVDCTREWVRVLKPSGSIFVNLGDKYTGAGGQWVDDERPDLSRRRLGKTSTKGQRYGLKPKSLLGLPWRYALACIDQLGLILRAEVIWSKPNSLPESVTDRVRRSHEQWFHMVRQPRYFSAVDEIREPHTWAHVGATRTANSKNGGSIASPVQGMGNTTGSFRGFNPLGKLPGSVWSIPSEPLTVPERLGVDHFAAFPTEWPRRLILGWSPSGICTVCGEGLRPSGIIEKVDAGGAHYRPTLGHVTGMGAPDGRAGARLATLRRITGYACACPESTAPTRPSVVLDPFGGTGTVALVATALGRVGISVDRSADYCRLAAWRTSDPGQRAKALQVPVPPKVSDDQLTLDFATQTDKAGTP